jgi:hypothetical protein
VNTSIDTQRALALQDQFGLKLAARLSQGSHEVPHDISERLRVARAQALSKRKKLAAITITQVNSTQGAGTLIMGGQERVGLWARFASAIPLIALLVGLVTINSVINDDRANEIAEVDSALLTDDLPPSAYADPGFTQFLKLNKEASR